MSLNFKVEQGSGIPKYQQLVDAIKIAIGKEELVIGQELPSVNSVSKSSKLSRETVYKAYLILKEQNIIDSVPSKGYYVTGETRRVLLVIDTFKAYKEVMYHSFINNLPDNFITDVQFHHYNIDNFKTIIDTSIGKYFKFVVMPFDNDEVPAILNSIPTDKLLLLDWNIYSRPDNNYVFQDFGQAFYDSLLQAKDLLKKYKSIHFIYPAFTNHSSETVDYFNKYCKDLQLESKVITDVKNWKIEKNVAYISVSDRVLGQFLEQCQELNFEPGKEVGFLSYNETPMKKFIYKGISVVSTDFMELGAYAARFVTNNEPMKHYVPTKLIIRESL